MWKNCLFVYVICVAKVHTSTCVQQLHHETFINETYSKFYKIDINTSLSEGTLHHFWESTGFCPPDPHQEAYKFILSSEMKYNFAVIGSLPDNGIKQIRIHWLLDLVKIQRVSRYRLYYSFTYLDQVIQLLWSNNLKPGFELMGNPSNVYHDFENSTEVYLWRDFVKLLAKRYIKKYGLDYVSKWNFETWNEPDHRKELGFNFTIKGFLNYYDACSEGLKAADPTLQLGGPGGSCHDPSSGHSPICWALLDHCNSGRNFFTDEKGVRINFISFHKKGNGSSTEIMKQELDTIQIIRGRYPNLAHVPIYNDEADPMVTWSKPLQWRADARYAAMVAKIIVEHVQQFYTNKTSPSIYKLLSNDNAFLSYYPHQFTQRTLLARFQINNTKFRHTEFIKKPVYSLIGLLGMLGRNLVYVEGNWRKESSQAFGALATLNHSDRFELALLLYNSLDISNVTGSASLKITIHGINKNSIRDIRWVQYHINNEKTNPYDLWKKMGCPAYPTISQFNEMRELECPFRPHKPRKAFHPWKFHLKLQLPGIILLYMCDRHTFPKYVDDIKIMNISLASVLITWKDTFNRCLLTYEIYFSKSGHSKSYKRINAEDTVFLSFTYSLNMKQNIHITHQECFFEGYYKVRAVDFWEQTGPFSKPVFYSCKQ